MENNNVEKQNKIKKEEKTVTMSIDNWKKFFAIKDFLKLKNSDETIENLYDLFMTQTNKKFKEIGNRVVVY